MGKAANITTSTPPKRTLSRDCIETLHPEVPTKNQQEGSCGSSLTQRFRPSRMSWTLGGCHSCAGTVADVRAARGLPIMQPGPITTPEGMIVAMMHCWYWQSVVESPVASDALKHTACRLAAAVSGFPCAPRACETQFGGVAVGDHNVLHSQTLRNKIVSQTWCYSNPSV